MAILNKIYQAAPEGWGTTLVNVCWGAWFGRVLMETGIASTLIRKTVELGGDRPIITIVLLNVVTAFIFTAMMGAGPVIAIGVIVLPICLLYTSDIISPNAQREVTPDLIIQIVSDHYGLTPLDISSQKRNKEIVYPRQIVMYLCRNMTDTPLQTIGRYRE